MALTIVDRNPAPGTVLSVGARPSFGIRSTGLPIDSSTVDVWLSGAKVIDGGQVVGDGSMFENLGIDADVVAAGLPLAQDDVVTVRVVANDTGGLSPIDESWIFETDDTRGPVATDLSPPAGSIVKTSPATITMRLTDPRPDYEPVLRIDEITTTVDFDGNEMYAAGVDLTGKEGRLFQATGLAEFRRIVSVQGPEHATFDGASLAGSGEPVTVYGPTGVDIHVDGQRIVHSGFLDADATGWAASLVKTQDIAVTLTPPGALTGRVRVGVLADDDNNDRVNASTTDYFFDIGDERGPQITNITPPLGSQGLDVSTTDVEFDITSGDGVDLAELNIEVNGVVVFTSSSWSGAYSGSPAPSAITDGYHVTMVRSTDYPDGQVSFFDITSKDTSGRDGERRVLRLHFGQTTGDHALPHGLGGTVVRVVAYDLSESPFARPVALAHTGYAWDGYRYDRGSVDTGDVASWHTELGNFPLSGTLIVTTGGWALMQDDDPWAVCAVGDPPTMAGKGTLTDADFARDSAMFAVSGDVVALVDFALDRCQIFDDSGRGHGNLGIAQRASAQTFDLTDATYSLPTGPCSHLALETANRSLVMVVAQSGSLTVLKDLTDEFEDELTGSGTPAPNLRTAVYASATWVRVRLSGLQMALASNDTGQGQVELWSWFEFLRQGTLDLFLDDGTTPALPAEEIRDLDFNSLTMVLAMDTELEVVDLDAGTLVSHDQTALGLAAYTGLSAVAAEAGLRPDLGQVYVAASSVADGGVVVFDVRTLASTLLDSGDPLSTISAVGVERVTVKNYIRTSMEVD